MTEDDESSARRNQRVEEPEAFGPIDAGALREIRDRFWTWNRWSRRRRWTTR